MKLLKQIGTSCVLAMMMMVGVIAPVFANQGWGGATQFGQNYDGSNTFTKDGTSAQGIGVAKAGDPQAGAEGGGLLDAVKRAINWILGLLALIALIICLWAGFKMLTAAGDSKSYEEGFTMLRQAWIGLVMIGISWLLVSFVFRVINIFTNTQ